jgi:hypothetical protein
MEASPDEQRLLTALTTEHFTLQGSRGSTVSESSVRSSLYLGALSSTLIGLGFFVSVGGASSNAFRVFALTALTTVFVLGIFTYTRLVQSSVEDIFYGRAINRIRHYYLEMAGDRAHHFMLVGNDDPLGVAALLHQRDGDRSCQRGRGRRSAGTRDRSCYRGLDRDLGGDRGRPRDPLPGPRRALGTALPRGELRSGPGSLPVRERTQPVAAAGALDCSGKAPHLQAEPSRRRAGIGVGGGRRPHRGHHAPMTVPGGTSKTTTPEAGRCRRSQQRHATSPGTRHPVLPRGTYTP